MPGLAEAVGDSVGDALGVGEGLCFFFLLEADREDSGDGLGEDFFFLGDEEELGAGVSDGVGLAAVFLLGDGDFSGVAVGFGVGDFSAIGFFFVCLRGVGVGVGTKIFFSLVPKDSSAGAFAARPPRITQEISAILIGRIGSGKVA
jgi:hypothetical protein